MTGLAADEAEAVKCLTSQIEDGISDAVCELLCGLARDVPEGQAIVEIGRGKGKPTVWLVRGSEAGKKNKVFSFASQKESPDSANADRRCVPNKKYKSALGVDNYANGTKIGSPNIKQFKK